MMLFTAGVFFVTDLAHMVIFAAMTVAMMALAVIDLEQQRLPNGFVLALAILALAWRWTGDRDMSQGLVAAAAVFAVGVMMNAGFQAITGRIGLGLGDTKLLAAAALALPLGPLLLFLAVAGGLGVVFGVFWRWRTAGAQFPFGPAILAAYWLALAGGDAALAELMAGMA